MQAAMLLAVLLPVQIPADKAPPQPDFKTPVDYVHWYNSFVRTGKRENAWDEYRMLLGDGAENKGMPLLEGKLKDSYDAARGRVWTRDEYPDLAKRIETCK